MKRVKGIFFLCLCLLSSLFVRLEAQKNAKPFVIPELTHWEGGQGSFIPSGRIVLEGRPSKELRQVALAFSKDYEMMTGVKMKVVQSRAKNGDFVFSLDAGNHKLGDEGYLMQIDEVCRLSAEQSKGLYWGTRTLLQMTEQSDKHILPQGTSRDIPQYALRGLLLDVARKYIPINYLHKLVSVMAYYKMNTLQIHLNDNGFKQYFEQDWSKTSSAFRLESSTYPGLARPGASYSKKEFIDLQIWAENNFVEIIPEIDVPAHTLAFAHLKPELGSKEYGMDHLDLFKPETYEFVDALFAEYLSGKDPVFRGKRVNIGTDEYSNKEEAVREKFRYFTDRYIKYIQSFGKQACLWGSLTHAYGQTPVESKDVLMMCWYNGYADPKEMKKQGYQLVSIPDGMTYIVPAAGYYYDYLNTKYLYDKWTPAVIGNQSFPDQDPAIEGGMFAVWNDHYGNGISTKDIHHRIVPAMQMIALKTWTAHATAIPYDEYERLRPKLSEAPGINELGRWGLQAQEVYRQEKVHAGDTLPREEIGYDYSVSFTLEARPELKGTELFRSDNAVFFLSDPREGKLGFARDGYLNTFNYRLPREGKVELRIEGTNKETRLFVDGKHRQTLAPETVYVLDGSKKLDVFYEAPDPHKPTVYLPTAKMHYQRTLVFPLRQAGQFQSLISNFRVHNYCLSASK